MQEEQNEHYVEPVLLYLKNLLDPEKDPQWFITYEDGAFDIKFDGNRRLFYCEQFSLSHDLVEKWHEDFIKKLETQLKQPKKLKRQKKSINWIEALIEQNFSTILTCQEYQELLPELAAATFGDEQSLSEEEQKKQLSDFMAGALFYRLTSWGNALNDQQLDLCETHQGSSSKKHQHKHKKLEHKQSLFIRAVQMIGDVSKYYYLLKMLDVRELAVGAILESRNLREFSMLEFKSGADQISHDLSQKDHSQNKNVKKSHKHSRSERGLDIEPIPRSLSQKSHSRSKKKKKIKLSISLPENISGIEQISQDLSQESHPKNKKKKKIKFSKSFRKKSPFFNSVQDDDGENLLDNLPERSKTGRNPESRAWFTLEMEPDEKEFVDGSEEQDKALYKRSSFLHAPSNFFGSFIESIPEESIEKLERNIEKTENVISPALGNSSNDES